MSQNDPQTPSSPTKPKTRWPRITSAPFPEAEGAAEAPDFDMPIEDDELPVPARPRINPKCALVEEAIARALKGGLRRRLGHSAPLSLVVAVPSASWLRPLEIHFAHSPFGRDWMSFARDGSRRARDKPTEGNDEVASALAGGKSVVGIAVDPERLLPSTLVAAADARLDVRLPDASTVRRVIRRCSNRPVPALADADIRGLDLEDMVAALRPKSSPREMVERLASASRSLRSQSATDHLPPLETAVEYGSARQFGLDLARDVTEYIANRLPWSAIDRGAVMFGPSGTGKSTLARMIAASCGIAIVEGGMGQFFAESSGTLDGIIKSQRELFARARALRPAIIFIDEIDAIPSRASLGGGSRNRDFWLPAITDLLLLLDDAGGASKREGIIVLAATNHIEHVDPALMRPGRLERAIEIAPPDRDGILNVLRFHAGEIDGSALGAIADALQGCTPAEIMEIVRRARRVARNAGRDLAAADLAEIASPAALMPLAMLRRIAVHEAGHVIAGMMTPGVEVGHVTFGAGGLKPHTSIRYPDERTLTREQIEKRAVILLAGRAAERAIWGFASTGSSGSSGSDLGQVSNLLAMLHLTFGLGDAGHVYMADPEDALSVLRRDPALRRIVAGQIETLEARAFEIVNDGLPAVRAIADGLMRKRYLSKADVLQILGQVPDAEGGGHSPVAAQNGSSPDCDPIEA